MQSKIPVFNQARQMGNVELNQQYELAYQTETRTYFLLKRDKTGCPNIMVAAGTYGMLVPQVSKILRGPR